MNIRSSFVIPKGETCVQGFTWYVRMREKPLKKLIYKQPLQAGTGQDSHSSTEKNARTASRMSHIRGHSQHTLAEVLKCNVKYETFKSRIIHLVRTYYNLIAPPTSPRLTSLQKKSGKSALKNINCKINETQSINVLAKSGQAEESHTTVTSWSNLANFWGRVEIVRKKTKPHNRNTPHKRKRFNFTRTDAALRENTVWLIQRTQRKAFLATSQMCWSQIAATNFDSEVEKDTQ